MPVGQGEEEAIPVKTHVIAWEEDCRAIAVPVEDILAREAPFLPQNLVAPEANPVLVGTNAHCPAKRPQHLHNREHTIGNISQGDPELKREDDQEHSYSLAAVAGQPNTGKKNPDSPEQAKARGGYENYRADEHPQDASFQILRHSE